MATTVSDLQTDLAYRLGEQSAPSNQTEKARRLSFLNAGYRDVMRRHYWWFTESSTTISSVADQEYYDSTDGVPTDLRLPLEVRYQNKLYRRVSQDDAMVTTTTPYNITDQAYFIFQNRLYFMPRLPSTVVDGISLKYYRKYTKLTADSDTILIPDEFADVLTAYAEARVSKTSDERGNAADAFDEFNEIMNMMAEEQNKYLTSLMDGETDSYALFES